MENNDMMLVMPSMKHRAAAAEYIREFTEAKEDINGMGLDLAIADERDAYGEWLFWLYGEGKETAPNGAERSFTYFFVDGTETKLIGTVNIRRGNDLAERYGNLGFAVRPSMRGRGFGTAMVEAAVSMCAFTGMDKVTAVCGQWNTASARVLEKCGFVRVRRTVEKNGTCKAPQRTKENGSRGSAAAAHAENVSRLWFERITGND